MNLKLLCATPHVNVYFDSWNNWLYVEWEGVLTLPAVQYACLEVAECFVEHAYSRVLNDDSQITSLPPEVAPWLSNHFFPHFTMAGIKQLAWVHAPHLRGLTYATHVIQQLPHLNVSLFADIEQATHWLKQSNPAYAGGHHQLPRPVAEATQFAQTVKHFRQALREAGVRAHAYP